jgi:hypothetical protein
MGSFVDSMWHRGYFFTTEAVSKCSILFKIKEGDNFNHRNALSISRIKI